MGRLAGQTIRAGNNTCLVELLLLFVRSVEPSGEQRQEIERGRKREKKRGEKKGRELVYGGGGRIATYVGWLES